LHSDHGGSVVRRYCFWCIYVLIFLASLPSTGAAECTAVFGTETLSLNNVIVGEVQNERAQLSLAGFVQTLGAPSRTDVHGQTQRVTWDTDGIQLEATNPESTPFAALFNFTAPDAATRGIIPSGSYQGTFDCIGIKLRSGQPLSDQARVLTAAGFMKDQTSAETWSLRLTHWAVYLRFTSGVIDSVVIRILPDIY
jgi:hypothetical protein